MGNQETKTSNKTKEEIEDGFSLRVITMSRASEPILQVETDLADSGACSGSVSNSDWCFCQWRTTILAKSKSQGQGISALT